ncbi:MAG: MarR family transcriptional regulator [Clostridia bacterium]|nr:MarR family transcriptional regulator [Clostridia bacterium]
MNKKYSALRLENQICFPLYAAAKEVVKKYRPLLDALNLTYTQYITLLLLWEHEKISSRELGERLFLDSGTLTPVLKSLERKGYVSRSRSQVDERLLDVSLTDAGRALKKSAWTLPYSISGSLNLDDDELSTLYRLLYKILN